MAIVGSDWLPICRLNGTITYHLKSLDCSHKTICSIKCFFLKSLEEKQTDTAFLVLSVLSF